MRSLVWTGAVAIIVTASGGVAGQMPGRPAPAVTINLERARIRLGLNPTAILDRILSFDANADDRISRDELPERMEGLVSRGDRNQDGFLTSDEIVPLIDSQRTARGGGISVSARRSVSLADIIVDLKLPPATHSRAMAIVTGPRPAIHDAGNVDFQTEMRKVLSDEDYGNYVAAAARLRNTAHIIGGIAGGVGQPPPPPAVP